MSAGTFIWVIALVIFAAIAIYGSYFSEAAKIRRALKAAQKKTIAEVTQGEVAKIVGRVRPITELLRAPLSGRRCVYFEATVEEYRSSGKSGSWVEIIRESEVSDFLVEDGTGRALVKTSMMKALLRKDTELTSGFLNDASADLEAFLRRHGRESKGWVFNKSLRYKEGVFEPGETVSVLGQAKWEHDPDPTEAGSGYRDVPKRLVMDGPDNGAYLFASDEPDTA